MAVIRAFHCIYQIFFILDHGLSVGTLYSEVISLDATGNTLRIVSVDSVWRRAYDLKNKICFLSMYLICTELP